MRSWRGGRWPKQPEPERELPNTAHYGGSTPWETCECGKFRDKKTRKHIEVISLTLDEFMERFGPKCLEKIGEV